MKTIDLTKYFAVAASLLVIAAVGGGIWLAGSPNKERQRNFDRQRVSDLQQISSAVDQFYRSEGRLPAGFDDLQKSAAGKGYFVRSFNDPDTKQAYEYSVQPPSSYELCAVFALPTAEIQDLYPPEAAPVIDPNTRNFTHDAGRACFVIDATKAFQPACSVLNPCPSGQSCAILRTGTAAVCVAIGKECLAAGCPDDSCQVEESYPMIVNCKIGNPVVPQTEPTVPPPTNRVK